MTEPFVKSTPLSGEDQALVTAYVRCGRTLDDLPYTNELDGILTAIGKEPSDDSRREVLGRLMTIRKSGRLPRSGARSTLIGTISPEDERTLSSLIINKTGSLGRRDSLPYTEAFKSILQEFQRSTGTQLAPHQLWRLMARVAK